MWGTLVVLHLRPVQNTPDYDIIGTRIAARACGMFVLRNASIVTAIDEVL